MKLSLAKRFAWEAFQAGALQACDPYVNGRVPRAIMRTIRRDFEAWWKLYLNNAVEL
jgi:hypothetical protein